MFNVGDEVEIHGIGMKRWDGAVGFVDAVGPKEGDGGKLYCFVTGTALDGYQFTHTMLYEHQLKLIDNSAEWEFDV